MKYYHNLYLSEGLTERKKEIIYKLEHDKLQWNKYVIVLAANEENHLEFYNSALLLQWKHRKKELFVVGIADGFEESLFLVEKIVQNIYDETGGADIRAYLLKKQREFEEKSR